MKIDPFNLVLAVLVAVSIPVLIFIHDKEVERRFSEIRNVTNEIIKVTEQAYFEGQKDALNGDIRILLVKDTLKDTVKWTWVKSPWPNGQKPLFVP